MNEIEIRAAIRVINRKIRHVKDNPINEEIDTDAIRELKKQRAELAAKIHDIKENKLTRLEELAKRLDFTLTISTHIKDLGCVKANWTYSDGLHHCSQWMSLECCYQYLLGFCAAKYEPNKY